VDAPSASAAPSWSGSAGAAADVASAGHATVPGGRLGSQMAFLLEIDALKNVLRQSLLADGTRRENTAEHSWHLAMCALVLHEHANEPVDVARVVELLLVHDLVEIYAGDTFVYASTDPEAAAAQEAREREAADRLFSVLPSDQGAHLRARWGEFESLGTAESRFAKAVDRLVPMVLNHVSGGGSWSIHEITADKTRALIDRTMPKGSEVLARYAHDLIDRAIVAGTILPPKT
jgi:putative hydrolases of HD superfamily